MAARPGLLCLHRRLPPAAAELHLVRAREIAGVTARVVLRPRARVPVVGVVDDAAVIDVEVGGEAAGRGQCEAGVDVGGARRGDEMTAGDEIAFALEEARRSLLSPRRLDRARRTRVAAGLALVVLVKGEGAAHAIVQLAVGLEGIVGERGVVRFAIERQQVDGGL